MKCKVHGLISSTDVRAHVLQRLDDARKEPVPVVPSQIALLRGVVTVRGTTDGEYAARASGMPWWNDPVLAACVLAMDDLGPSGGSSS